MMWLWSLSPWKIDTFCVMSSSVALSQCSLSMCFLCHVRHCSECALIPHAMTARLEMRCLAMRRDNTTSGIKCWNSSQCREPAQCYNMIWKIGSYAGRLYHVILHWMLCLPLQYDLCIDDAANVGMYQTAFEDYAHGELVFDENSDGHIG